MIVKNEARFIEGCLQSVKSIVDEIVIVDTGSTDTTLDLVRPFNPQILHFAWCDDFSKARNFGLNAAQTPWILMLDADERIAARDLPLLVEAAKLMEFTGFELLWRNYGFNTATAGLKLNPGDYEEGNGYPGFSEDPMFRMYRNHPGLRYEGLVHEHITWRTFPNKKVEVLPAVIHHYGRALGEQRAAQKGEMYLRLGYQKLEQFPTRWEPLYEISLQLQEFNRHAESIPYLEKAIKMADSVEDRGRMLLFLASALKRTGKPAEAIDRLQQSLKLGYKNCSVFITLGNLYAAQGQTQDARAAYEIACKTAPDSALPALNLGLLLRDTGDFAAAEVQFRTAMGINPNFTTPAVELATLCSSQNRLQEAASLLQDVLQHEPESRTARQSLAKVYIQLQRPDDALQVLEKADHEAVSEALRGVAYSEKGDPETARTILENVVKKNRTLTGARVNLATAYARMGEFAKAVRHLAIAYEQTKDPALLKMAQDLSSRQKVQEVQA